MQAVIALLALGVVLPVAAVHVSAEKQASAIVPKGWILAGSKPQNYLTGIDPKCSFQRMPCAKLEAKPTATEGFGTLMQEFSASDYLGKRVRLTAWVKSENISDWAGLWVRIDSGARVRAFDNMQDRAIKGTTDWRKYSIVLDVPNDATGIFFGILLSKSGEVWVSGVKFETVGADVPLTGGTHPPPPPPPPLPQGPSNLDFVQ